MFESNVEPEEIDNFYKQVSKNVKRFREEKGISQLELALTIGQKQGAFFNYAENNTNCKHFNLEHLYKISKALNIELCELIQAK